MNLDIWECTSEEKRLVRSFKALKSPLSLTLEASLRGGDELIHFLSSLRNRNILRSICVLKLYVSDCPWISKFALDALCFYLGYFSCLKVFKLSISNCCNINEQDIREVSRSLKNLTSLESFDFSFLAYRKKQEISMFDKTTRSFLSQLPQGVTDITMEHLCSGISHTSNLSTLELGFSRCDYITDKTILTICKTFPHTPSLSTLRLEFSDCSSITDNSIQALSLAVSQVNTLSVLDLRFFHCVNISDESVESLPLRFSHLTSLSALTLVFEHCKRLSDKTITRSLVSKLLFDALHLTINRVLLLTVVDLLIESEDVCLIYALAIDRLSRGQLDVTRIPQTTTGFRLLAPQAILSC